MLFIRYNQLPANQKKLVNHKITMRTKAPPEIVHNVLTRINPPVKINGKDVITMYHILDSIQQKIKEEEKSNGE